MLPDFPKSVLRRLFAAALEAEIFSAGTWNDVTYTADDLHEMVRNFAALKNLLKPVLKLGHDDAQRWFGQGDGAPSLGWVSALRVTSDNKLMAKFEGVPTAVAELIRKGAYRRVSAEIYHDIEFEENGEPIKLGKALGAVALLGADMPAVTNLADLAAMFGQDHRSEVRKFTQGQLRVIELDPQLEEEPMYVRKFSAGPDPEQERLRVALESSTKALNTANDQVKQLTADLEKHKQVEQDKAAEHRATEFIANRNKVMTSAEELVAAGQLPPYLRDELLKEVLLQERSYTGGELRFTQGLIVKLTEAVKKGEVGTKVTGKQVKNAQGKISDAQDQLKANETLAAKVKEAMAADKKLTFEQATLDMMKANPDLAQANLESALLAEKNVDHKVVN